MLLILSLPVLDGCPDAICRGLALGLVPGLGRGLQGTNTFWAELHQPVKARKMNRNKKSQQQPVEALTAPHRKRCDVKEIRPLTPCGPGAMISTTC